MATRWTHGLINRLVLLCDILMSAIGTALAHLAWEVAPFGQLALLWAFGLLIFTELLRLGNAYRVEQYTTGWRQLRHLLVGLFPAGIAVLAAYLVFVPSWERDVGDLAKWGLLTFLFVLFGRLVLVRYGVSLAERHKVLQRNVVLIGAPGRVRSFLEQSAQAPLLNIVGIFSDEADGYPPTVGNVPFRGRIENLFDFVLGTHVDVVVILQSWNAAADIGRTMDRVHRLAADVFVPLEPDAVNLRYASLSAVAGIPSLQVQRQPLKGSLGVLKQVEDYVIAITALIVVSPVMLVAAIAIRLTSPGPVLFKQERIGFNNRPFVIYKFRTMTYDPTDDGSAGTRRNDPRVTPLGGFLRRTSIDELPQLINVLEGDMSVVGPRPHVPNMQIGSRRQFDAVREYAARYRMKPGITGWAQINGMRGGIHTMEKAQRGVKLDLYYIENWSIWLDLKIILLTVTKGMAGQDVF
jgi:polysaccharide biosynthesis protein PslA